AIVESAAESFFADASINTSITVLERKSDARARTDNSIKFVRLNGPLSEIVETRWGARTKDIDWSRALANEIDRECHSVTTDAYRVRIIEQARLMACTGGPPWPPLDCRDATIAKRSTPLRHLLT